MGVLFGPIWYKVSWSAYPQDVQHSETRYHRDQEGSGRHRPLQPGCSGQQHSLYFRPNWLYTRDHGGDHGRGGGRDQAGADKHGLHPRAANSTFDNVVKTTVLLADINDFAAVNAEYTKFFKSNYPARAAYQVAALPRGARVEIEAVAVVGNITNVP